MFLVFTLIVLSIYLLSSFAIIYLCEHVFEEHWDETEVDGEVLKSAKIKPEVKSMKA